MAETNIEISKFSLRQVDIGKSRVTLSPKMDLKNLYDSSEVGVF